MKRIETIEEMKELPMKKKIKSASRKSNLKHHEADSSSFKSEELYNSEPKQEEEKEEGRAEQDIQEKIDNGMKQLDGKFSSQISSLMELI